MIDDVTVVMTTAHLGEIRIDDRVRSRAMPCPDGQVRPWRLMKVRGGVVRYQPDLAILTVTLNLARLSYPASSSWTYNFPLCSSPWELDLDPISREILAVLGVYCGERESAAAKAGLLDAGVKKIAYAFDASTDDGEETVLALTRLRRRHARQAQTFYRPGEPAHAFQYEANDRRLMFYRKDEEIKARIRPLRGRHREYGQLAKKVRDELAERARDVVRVELTLKNTKAVRAVWGLAGGRLPTLQFMLRQEVGAYLLDRELEETGLRSVDPLAADLTFDDQPDFDEAESAGDASVRLGGGGAAAEDDLVELLHAVSDASRRSREAGVVGAGRGKKGIHGTRVLLLTAMAHLQRRVSKERLMELTGIGDGAYRGLMKDLDAIGMPAGAAPDHLVLLRRLVDEFDTRFPRVPAALPAPSDGDLVAAPWADRLGGKHDDGVDDDYLDVVVDVDHKPGVWKTRATRPRCPSSDGVGGDLAPTFDDELVGELVDHHEWGFDTLIEEERAYREQMECEANGDFYNEEGEDEADDVDPELVRTRRIAERPKPCTIPANAPTVVHDLVAARDRLDRDVDHFVLGEDTFMAFAVACEDLGWPHGQLDGAPTLRDRKRGNYLAAVPDGGGDPLILYDDPEVDDPHAA